MLLARPAGEPQSFHVSDGSADGEFARVLRTADPGPSLAEPLTFLPGDAWLPSWQKWRGEVLIPHLVPMLLQTAAYAVRGCPRENLALDRALNDALSPDSRTRSRAAGQRLLARLASSRGERCLGKFQQWIVADQMAAHFATIHATQHALFHLPPRLLIPSYAHWEWSAAGGEPAEFAEEAGSLCRIAQDLPPALSSVHATAFHVC